MADPRALLQKAEKTLAGASGGFSFFGGREEKYQTAADTFIEAANAFRMQRQDREAGQAFEKAAQVYIKNLNEPDDAANVFVDAFKVYRQNYPEDAARCIDFAIQRYCAKGNFRRAATHKEGVGEIYELQLGDLKRAQESYEAAAGWYEGDNASALANKLWLKVADIAALNDDYYKAIENYEKVASSAVNNNLMRYSVKEYFLKAGICHLATADLVSAKRAVEKYTEMDPTFASQKEFALLSDLTECVENQDGEAFGEKLYLYDQVSKLDKWKTTMLLKVKKTIEDADNEFA